MENLLWILSTAGMLALLMLLALRALEELLGVRVRLSLSRAAAALGRFSPAAWPWPIVFLVSVGVLWLGSYYGYKAMNWPGEGFLARMWVRFTEAGDAPHYLFIAENGYVSAGENVNNIVFYPLYPFLLRLLGKLLGGRYALAGLLLSQVCCGMAGVMFQKLAKKDCPCPGAAMAAYWLYPFGFFCLGVFTEGLFLLLTITGLWAIRERKWLLAGAAGFLCALTRAQGMLLLLPGIYCAWRDMRDRGWKFEPRYLALLAPALGWGLYLGLNRAVCGDWFAFRYYESIAPWWQTPQWLGDTLAQQFSMGVQYPGLANWIYWPQLFIYFIAAALLMAGWKRRLDNAHVLYGTAYLGMSYTASWLISGGRYMLGCTPMYLAAGSLKNRAVRALILGGELVMFLYYAACFMRGEAIM